MSTTSAKLRTAAAVRRGETPAPADHSAPKNHTAPADRPERHDHGGGFTYRYPIVAFLIAITIAAVVSIPLSRLMGTSADFQTATTVFAAIFVQAVPFLLLGVVISGLIAAFVSPSALARALPKSQTGAVMVAGLGGAALPGCECGSVPVARRLFDSGLPAGVAVTFLLSAPAINPVVLVSTAVAFPGDWLMVVGRFVGSLATAVIMGMLWLKWGKTDWITARLSRYTESDEARWRKFVDAASTDLLTAGSFLVVGGFTVATLHVIIPMEILDSLGGNLFIAIIVMAVLAVVLALCSEADAFVVAAMTTMPRTAQLVFLVVGPAVDLKLVAMQWGTFGRKFAARFAPVTFLVAIAAATTTGLILL